MLVEIVLRLTNISHGKSWRQALEELAQCHAIAQILYKIISSSNLSSNDLTRYDVSQTAAKQNLVASRAPQRLGAEKERQGLFMSATDD